jgi:aspartate/methionine/tyrosine aminotransferase
MRYPGDYPSVELCERIRQRQNTLIVPGSYLGMEGYLRIWLGARPEYLEEGLRRLQIELT